MLDRSNNHPHIIALGLSPKEILHYYIEVEQELIDVSYAMTNPHTLLKLSNNSSRFDSLYFFMQLQIPSEYTFVDVADILFKLHYVFNIDFEPNIGPAMNFLRHYVYKIEDRLHPPSNKMRDVWTKLCSTGNWVIDDFHTGNEW